MDVWASEKAVEPGFTQTTMSGEHGDGITSSPQSQTPNRSRASSQYSGSDYSRPQTPTESRSSLALLGNDTSGKGNHFENVSLNTQPTSNVPTSSASQLPQRLTSKLPHFVMPLMTQPDALAASESSKSGGGKQSNPDTPTVTSPMTPQDPHMSMHSLQSLAFAESIYDMTSPPIEQAAEFIPTPKQPRSKHSRKPSSLEMLENVWATTSSSPQESETIRPPPPQRQSTLFDVSKDQPLTPTTPTTPVNDVQQKEENTQSNAKDNRDTDLGEDNNTSTKSSSAPTLIVADSSSVWRTERHAKRVSSLFAPSYVPQPDFSPEEDDMPLDWTTLDRTEEQEKEDKDLPEGVEDESTQFLLARLEQENAKFSADPKSSTNAATHAMRARAQTQTRPPSMAHLKKLVTQQEAPSIRFSLVSDAPNEVAEEPPPMTELEFWAALVQDYPSTAVRLPTLTTTKIRAGIPHPLRGVVWASMSGARDSNLEEAYETLQHEESPYEGIINKDIGRSFPGVEMFQDPEGEGQKMLGRVLKCFSLHDKDIGYCQGLGFLVGPLLMNIGEKESFCVLVRLMEHYALRPSFLPSLSGLHMRIFQFSILVTEHLPKLSEHLGDLGIEPPYLSQWFLSCFAVTCPLPMLFRIYDVIFAEGANETVMRVALSLFRRNEEKMLAFTEFEEVMELLLGRSIWDVYGCNADELVDDFTSLGNIVTHARLAELEMEFERQDGDTVGLSAGFLPEVQAAASRFLGRLWAPTHGHTPSKSTSVTPTPQTTEKESSAMSYLTRPVNLLRRTPSKQSLGTINDNTSSESSASSGSASITSTAPTETEMQDSGGHDSISMKSKTESMATVPGSASIHATQMSTTSDPKEQELQTEIENLLMALSDMQREHAQMSAMLQKEREDRNDDHRVVKQLLSKLTNGEAERKTGKRKSLPPLPKETTSEVQQTISADKRKSLPPKPRLHIRTDSRPMRTAVVVQEGQQGAIEELVDKVQTRLDSNARLSASFETKAQLRGALSRTREQLITTEAQVKDLSERLETSESSLLVSQDENDSFRLEVEELRARVNDDFKTRQKLELTIENLQIQIRMEAKALDKKQRRASLVRGESSGEITTLKNLGSPSRSRSGSLASNPSNPSGLRELKLGREDSVSSAASFRSFKSQRQTGDEWPSIPPPIEIPSSPPRSPTIELTPTAPMQPVLPQSTSLSVPAPSGANFARRTSSLATQEVFASKQHEPVPEEALLLELVNAKTAEATARSEIDEMKKAMQLQKRRAEESLYELQEALTSAKMELDEAREEAEMAREEADQARAEVFDASALSTPVTPGSSFPFTRGDRLPVGPAGSIDNPKRPTPPRTTSASPLAQSEPREAEPASSGLGGWFWNKRSPSHSKVSGVGSLTGDR